MPSLTVKMVGKAAFIVIDRSHASTFYPMGQDNLT
jgi:hypothetical protein